MASSETTSTSLTVGQFNLPTPAGWHMASLILVGPPDMANQNVPGQASGFQQNLVVVSEPVEEDETTEAYVKKQTAKLKEQKALHLPPGPLEPVTLPGGRSGVLFEHVVLGPNREKVRQMQLISVSGGTVYALIASHMDGLPFEAQRDAFRGILVGATLPG